MSPSLWRITTLSTIPLGLLAAALACGDSPTVASTAGNAELSRAAAHAFSPWSAAISMTAVPGNHPSFNSPALDGCPYISRDGKSFYMASTRAGSVGIDIWVSTRDDERSGWGAPVNVGAPINSDANDFCPTLARDGHLFFFASNRPGGCGGDDLYVSRLRGDGSYDEPENLGCEVNSAANEAGPFLLQEPGTGTVLYFSSFRAGGVTTEAPGATSGDSDLYMSEWRGGRFVAPVLVPGVNSAADDGQPNLRRDALELYFYSTRPGTLGMADIYVATRASAHVPWATPVNLGPSVNSAAGETRPSLSWDGSTLYFGSTRPGGLGGADIHMTTRTRLSGGPR